MFPLLLTLLFTWSQANSNAQAQIQRRDFFVASDPGIRIYVREIFANPNRVSGPAIILIHGARVPGVASFDLAVPGGSLAADLAARGFDVYVPDIRGYGRSTRPHEMDDAPEAHAPLVRSNEAARDLAAVVDQVRQRRPRARIVLFGWATGGQWAGYYASAYPGRISTLILLNSLYRGSSKHELIGRGSDLEDPAHPGRFHAAACGGYRWNDANSLLRPWDHSIPGEAKNAWRDRTVAEAYVREALASDPKSPMRTPPAFRSPCGALEDSFYLAIGRQLWDASLITVPTLVIASEHDFWSRPEDRQNLVDDLVHAPKVQLVTIPEATHFVHLDRPERGRDVLLKEVAAFALAN